MNLDFSGTIFSEAIPIMQRIENHGYEAYFVGGSVRDLFLNRPIDDIDIATSAMPDEIQEIFKHTIEIGKEHGTIIVVENNKHYEITTFRTEGEYSDFRRPDEVFFVRNLKEDTLRRDFTINALALDKSGKLYDYHNGQEDLKLRCIRAVGNPNNRFQEDALRILRGLRFASQLNFEIEMNTLLAMRENASLIQHLAFERIQEEFNKFLTGKYFCYQFKNLVHSGVVTYISLGDPNKLIKAFKLLMKDAKAYYNYGYSLDIYLAWAKLFEYLKLNNRFEQVSVLRYWKFSNREIEKITMLYKLFQISLSDFEDATILYGFHPDIIKIADSYYQIVQGKSLHLMRKYKTLPIHSKSDLEINGKEIMELLFLNKGGPIIGKLLSEIEKNVLERKLPNNKSAIKKFILAKK